MNIETDERILKSYNKIGREYLKSKNRLDRKLNRFWKRYAKRDDISGNLTIKDPKMVKKAVEIQKNIDEENFQALKCFLKGRVAWQGWI